MAKKRKLVFFREEEGGPEFLDYSSPKWHMHGERPALPKEVSLNMLAEMCDQDAENKNRHDFCGAHKALAKFLRETLPIKTVEKVMYELAERGGLHGMNGLE